MFNHSLWLQVFKPLVVAGKKIYKMTQLLLVCFPGYDRMGFLLNQDGHLHSHSHGHGHSHGQSPALAGASSSQSAQQQRPHGSLAVRAAFIHALGDLLQSVGVLIAAYIVRFKVCVCLLFFFFNSLYLFLILQVYLLCINFIWDTLNWLKMILNVIPQHKVKKFCFIIFLSDKLKRSVDVPLSLSNLHLEPIKLTKMEMSLKLLNMGILPFGSSSYGALQQCRSDVW